MNVQRIRDLERLRSLLDILKEKEQSLQSVFGPRNKHALSHTFMPGDTDALKRVLDADQGRDA